MEEENADLVRRNTSLQDDLHLTNQSFQRRLASLDSEYQVKIHEMEENQAEMAQRLRKKFDKLMLQLRGIQNLHSQQIEKVITERVDALSQQTRRQVEAEAEKKLQQ